MSTNEFWSAECSQPQPRSKTIPGAGMTVWPRPPTRSRASSTMTESPECFSACAAPRPAAPAPMMATSTSEGKDMARSVSWSCPALSQASTSARTSQEVDGREEPDKPATDDFPVSRARGSGDRFSGPFRALAVVGVKKLLAQPDRLRGHLDQFVFLDVGKRLFQRHLDRRRQA